MSGLLLLIAEAASDNALAGVQIPSVAGAQSPGLVGTIGGILGAIATSLSVVYILWRRFRSDSREDKSADMQQNVFTQLNAAVDKFRDLLDKERQHSADLSKRMTDRDSEWIAQRIAWDEERRQMVAEFEVIKARIIQECQDDRKLADAERRITVLNGDLTRAFDNLRVLGDELALIKGSNPN